MELVLSTVAQGLLWAVLAIGLFITFRILDIADLTVDGTMCTGGAVCIMMLMSGHNIWISMLGSVSERPVSFSHRKNETHALRAPLRVSGFQSWAANQFSRSSASTSCGVSPSARLSAEICDLRVASVASEYEPTFSESIHLSMLSRHPGAGSLRVGMAHHRALSRSPCPIARQIVPIRKRPPPESSG